MQTKRIKKGNLHVDYAATNPIVTNQAMEFLQSEEGFTAVRDVPLIRVPAASGKLAIVKQEYINRDEVALRSDEMTEAKKGMLGVGTVDYTTDARSLEYILSASDAAKLGYEYGMDVPATIPRALATKANIHLEVRFAALWSTFYRTVTGNSTDSGSEGTTSMNRKFWADTTNDPIAAIKAEKRIFLLRTGKMPTNLRLGYQLFETIASHPLVRAQVNVIVGGSTKATLFTPMATAEQLSMLVGMKVSVSWGIKNTSLVDGTETNAFIVDTADALMTFDTPGDFSATDTGAGGPPVVALGAPTGFARVAWEGVAPNGFQIRGPIDRPTIGSGGSRSWILDLYQGYVIVNTKFGTFFNNMIS